MKVGSLVELVDDSFNERVKGIACLFYGYVYPVKAEIYTIREIYETPYGRGILLEEIKNPEVVNAMGLSEMGFTIERFRELQPPMDISELIEESIYQTV